MNLISISSQVYREYGNRFIHENSIENNENEPTTDLESLLEIDVEIYVESELQKKNSENDFDPCVSLETLVIYHQTRESWVTYFNTSYLRPFKVLMEVLLHGKKTLMMLP